MRIKELVTKCHETSVKHGWWEAANASLWTEPDEIRLVVEKLCLIHAEVSEALEELRKNGLRISHTVKDRPAGFADELADVLIRVFDLCGYLNIDLEKALKEKMKYNETRPYRHGGKLA